MDDERLLGGASKRTRHTSPDVDPDSDSDINDYLDSILTNALTSNRNARKRSEMTKPSSASDRSQHPAGDDRSLFNISPEPDDKYERKSVGVDITDRERELILTPVELANRHPLSIKNMGFDNTSFANDEIPLQNSKIGKFKNSAEQFIFCSIL